jgi:hypothetical protein
MSCSSNNYFCQKQSVKSSSLQIGPRTFSKRHGKIVYRLGIDNTIGIIRFGQVLVLQEEIDTHHVPIFLAYRLTDVPSFCPGVSYANIELPYRGVIV